MINYKNRPLKILVSVLSAILILIATLLSGCLFSGDTKAWMLKVIESNYYFYDDMNKEGLEDLSIEEIAARLDIYSGYYTAEEYEREINDNDGKKIGLGISSNFVEGKGVYVVTVVENSPAREAGITPGDIIVSGKIGDKVTQFTSYKIFTDFLLAFGEDEEFTLSTADKDFTVAKSDYTAGYTFMATSDTAWEFASAADGGLYPRENPARARDYLPDDAAYINLSQFFGSASAEMGVLFEKFNAMEKKTMILDLRNNGGGYVSVMQDIAGYFVSSIVTEDRVAMTAEYRNGRKQLWPCTKQKGAALISEDTDIYVLANSGTASASEALIGVLVSYGFLDYEDIFISDFSETYLEWAGAGAKTARTYGKGIMQSTFVNRGTGEALTLTTARIGWPNGKCIHDVALSEKDGCTLSPAEWTATKNDDELRGIIEVINGRE